MNDPSNAIGQTVNRRHKPPFVRVYSRVFKSQLPPVARKTNKQNSQDKLGQTSGNNIKYWTIPRCAHDGLHFQLGQDKWKLARHAKHKEREEGTEREGERGRDRETGRTIVKLFSLLHAKFSSCPAGLGMRHEASRPNRCTASGRRGARCRDLCCCCCCYGSTASGSVDIWLLFADTVVINRVKQDNAQVVEGKGSRRSGKPRPRLTLWARLKHFSSSYTVFFYDPTHWMNSACMYLKFYSLPSWSVYSFLTLSNGDRIYSTLVNHCQPIQW